MSSLYAKLQEIGGIFATLVAEARNGLRTFKASLPNWGISPILAGFQSFSIKKIFCFQPSKIAPCRWVS